jgi:pyruvate dehydrogenase E1 component beta subunit
MGSVLAHDVIIEKLKYKQEATRAMDMLAEEENVVFLGQTVVYPGSVLSSTFNNIDRSKKLELPVMEECQMGMSIGLALEGYLPISVYPRIDFLLLTCNQLANHLDVMDELTHGEFKAKVIIRTIIGATKPMYPGVQHCRDHTDVFKALLHNVEVIKINYAEQVLSTYVKALNSDKSSLIIERAELY